MLDCMQNWGGARGSFWPRNFTSFNNFTFELRDIDSGKQINYKLRCFCFIIVIKAFLHKWLLEGFLFLEKLQIVA